MVRCPYCGYTWDYKGKRMWVTCPNCGRKFRIDKQSPVMKSSRGSIEVMVMTEEYWDRLVECVEKLGLQHVFGRNKETMEISVRDDDEYRRLLDCVGLSTG